MKPALSSALTLLISAFLLLEGIWGLFSPVVYWVLTTNRAHAIIHLVLGVAGLVARRKGAIKSYFGFLGSLLLVVAVIWIVPAWRAVPRDLLNINWQVATLNFILGLVSLVIAFTENSRRRFGVPGAGTQPPMKVPRKAA
jgi:hypothetical protein